MAAENKRIWQNEPSCIHNGTRRHQGCLTHETGALYMDLQWESRDLQITLQKVPKCMLMHLISQPLQDPGQSLGRPSQPLAFWNAMEYEIFKTFIMGLKNIIKLHASLQTTSTKIRQTQISAKTSKSISTEGFPSILFKVHWHRAQATWVRETHPKPQHAAIECPATTGCLCYWSLSVQRQPGYSWYASNKLPESTGDGKPQNVDGAELTEQRKSHNWWTFSPCP